MFYTGGADSGGGTRSLVVETTVNGEVATKPGPVISGTTAQFNYSVKNTGNAALSNVVIRSRQKLPVLGAWSELCSIGNLQPGATGSCSATQVAVSGTYKALVVARATSAQGVQTEALNDVFYRF